MKKRPKFLHVCSQQIQKVVTRVSAGEWSDERFPSRANIFSTLYDAANNNRAIGHANSRAQATFASRNNNGQRLTSSGRHASARRRRKANHGGSDSVRQVALQQATLAVQRDDSFAAVGIALAATLVGQV
jgi:hypothetical protein